MTTNSIKEDDIQNQILHAAKKLFQIHGLRKVTMDDVAKAIGKGRSSLYYYYKSKEEILDAVMDGEINDMITAITRAVDKATTAEEKLYAFFISKLQLLRERGPFYSTLDVGMDADEMSNYNKVRHALHNRIMKLEGAVLHQLLDQAIETGELKKMSKRDQDTLVFVLLSTLHGLKKEMAIDSFSGAEQAAELFAHMAIHGLKK